MLSPRAAKADVGRDWFWRAELFVVLALFAFVAIVIAIDIFVQPALSGPWLLLVGLVLALVPGLLWLLFFYLQDRIEPEPIGHVARLFVVGAALGGAFGLPVLNDALRVQEWLYRDSATMAIGSLLIGAIDSFVIYAAVRFFIFDSPEFDERTDGVVYGTAAGLGSATIANLHFILASGGAAFGPGEVYVAEVALAQAAFGGLLGYFLGRAKLEREPIWWLAAGFGLTVLLDAAFHLLRGQIETGTLVFGAAGRIPSLTGLFLAGGLAVLVTAVVSVLVNRDIQRTRQGGARPPAADAVLGDRQANRVVVAVFALLLLIGLIGWHTTTNAMVLFFREGVRGAYPASYTLSTADDALLDVADPLVSGTRFRVRAFAGQDLAVVATQLAGERGASAAFYRVTEQAAAMVAGRDALRQRFAMVETGAFVGVTPRVVEGIDYLLIDDDRVVVVSLIADADSAASEAAFEQFVQSLSLAE
ncbi:MAG: hypothetical protein Fur005_10210 [Roseiflexaceae bacterium]